MKRRKKTEFYLLRKRSLSEGDLFITDYIRTKQRLEILEERLIQLNNLIGKKILIGNVKVEGIDLCRPCRHLAESLKQDNILKEFLRRGGLRCQILSSSKINVGDEIKILD